MRVCMNDRMSHLCYASFAFIEIYFTRIIINISHSIVDRLCGSNAIVAELLLLSPIQCVQYERDRKGNSLSCCIHRKKFLSEINFFFDWHVAISHELEMGNFSSNQRIILCTHLIESTSIKMKMLNVTTF